MPESREIKPGDVVRADGTEVQALRDALAGIRYTAMNFDGRTWDEMPSPRGSEGGTP